MMYYYTLTCTDNQFILEGHGNEWYCTIVTLLCNFVIFLSQPEDKILINNSQRGYFHIKFYSDVVKQQIHYIVNFLQHMDRNENKIFFKLSI